MTRLEQIEGCRFSLVRDGEFDVITIRTLASGNDDCHLSGNDARIALADYLLAGASALLGHLVPSNLPWTRAQEHAIKCKAEYRRLKEPQ